MRELILIVIVNFILCPNSEAFNTGNRQQYVKYSGPDQLYFPPTSYQFDIEQLFRIQRAINGRTKTQSITPKLLPQSPMIFFDEDDDEPLAPEPKFELRIGTPTKKTMLKTTLAPIPRWPPMMSSISPKVVVTPPVSKVTFFPKVTPKPSENKVKNGVTSPKPQTSSSKIKQQGKPTTTPMSATTLRTKPIISPVSENIQIENGVENDEILLEGSFYAPFLKPENK